MARLVAESNRRDRRKCLRSFVSGFATGFWLILVQRSSLVLSPRTGICLASGVATVSMDGGVSIGFSPSKIIEYTQRHSFIIGRCIYDSETKSHLAEQVINAIISTAELNGASPEFHPSQSYYGIFREIEPELLRIAALVKDRSFHEEKEWRVVSQIFSNYIEPPIKFREGSSMLIPYIEMPLAESGQKIQIEDIFVGPSPTMNLSVDSLSRYLRRSAMCGRIASCGIPHRR